MSRKPKARTKYIKLNKIKCDTRYESNLVSKLIKVVMKNGKFNLATSIVYDAIDIFYDDYMKRVATSEEKNIEKE